MQPTQAMPPGTDPTAVVGKRIGAFIIDWLLGVALAVGLFFAVTTFTEYDASFAPRYVRAACDSGYDGGPSGSHVCFHVGDKYYYADGAGSATPQLAYWAYSIGVFIIWQGLTGKTIGKVLMGIRVVNAEGRPPGIGRAFLRQLLWVVDLFPYCIPGLTGFLVANSDKNHQRVGDKVASTYVVGKAWVGHPVGAAAAPPPGWGTPVAGAPMPGMTGMPPAAPPTMPPAAAPAAPAMESTPAPAADPTQPQWDPARNAYIAWDATAQVWKQFDDASQEWRPI